MTLLIAAACAAVAVAGVVLTVVRAVPDSDDGGPPFSGPVIIGAASPLAALAVARMAAIHEDRPPAGETALAALPPAQDDPATSYRDRPSLWSYLSDDTIARGFPAVADEAVAS